MSVKVKILPNVYPTPSIKRVPSKFYLYTQKMANTYPPLILPFCFLTLTLIIYHTVGVAASGDIFKDNWVHATNPKPQCHDTLAECMVKEEIEMGMEINRRILATSNYISYQALRSNSIPCSRRGSSYYNCRVGSQANPYSRQCTTLTQCRS